MSGYKFPKGIVAITFVGAAYGGGVLLKDYIGGNKYGGDEKIYARTVIITGANTGIGKETAKALASRGGKIIMACRDMEKCEAARKEIVEESPNKKVFCKELDLASMSSIRKFAEDVNKNERRLDILVNNAGVMRCPKTLTEDGFEMQLGVNHLGHFLLTNLLLDKLKNSAPSRIINVSSLAYTKGKINFDDLNSDKEYDPAAAYNQSKLANILFTKELAKRMKGTGVTVNALYPGLVKTEIGRHMPMEKSVISSVILSPFTWLLLKTPKQGAYTTEFCAVAAEVRNVTGKFFSECKEKDLSDEANDEEVAKRLWLVSEKWTRITNK